MICKNCDKKKEEHVNGRWCYKIFPEGCASSADWQEFVPHRKSEEVKG